MLVLSKRTSLLKKSKHDSLYLTLSRRRPLSYRNQSIDLLRKSVDWFLYDNDLRFERVNSNQTCSYWAWNKVVSRCLNFKYVAIKLWNLQAYFELKKLKKKKFFLKNCQIKCMKTASKNNKEIPIWYVHNIFRKIVISEPLISTRTSALQGVRNASFSRKFAYVLIGGSLIAKILFHQHALWAYFKDTRSMSICSKKMTSFWYLYCYLGTNFTHCSCAFTVNSQ